VIGDTPFDVHCARAIDAMAVAVGTGGYGLEELASENPDLLVADLSETDLTDWLR
jgi:phosphoglycolate phosphatase